MKEQCINIDLRFITVYNPCSSIALHAESGLKHQSCITVYGGVFVSKLKAHKMSTLHSFGLPFPTGPVLFSL